ncbi:MAG: hypothetical protein H6736_18220 [Alphaproteobacteria bacterium]|nr:hypothetical protein [Alphaproteobacteria bacterium]MCB9693751.1 hypothetical protein [Alphaproteobacteria bacterium]
MIAFTLLAHADVVMPAPGCVDGTYDYPSHDGSFCAPRQGETTCPDGETLRSIGLCVTREERECGGNSGPDCTYMRAEAHSACAPDGSCAVGTCETADRCAPVPPPPPPPPPPAAGMCGCMAAGTPGLAVAFGLLPLVVRRRGSRCCG